MDIKKIKQVLTEENVRFEDVDYLETSGMNHFCKIILENDQNFEDLSYNLTNAAEAFGPNYELGTIYADCAQLGGNLVVEILEL